MRRKTSVTGRYLSGREKIATPAVRRQVDDDRRITILDATENNLNHLTADIPLGLLVAVTGVSGAGKSTLINQILYPALAGKLHGALLETGRHEAIHGLAHLDKVINIDQKAIGRTPPQQPGHLYQGLRPHPRFFRPAARIQHARL